MGKEPPLWCSSMCSASKAHLSISTCFFCFRFASRCDRSKSERLPILVLGGAWIGFFERKILLVFVCVWGGRLVILFIVYCSARRGGGGMKGGREEKHKRHVTNWQMKFRRKWDRERDRERERVRESNIFSRLEVISIFKVKGYLHFTVDRLSFQIKGFLYLQYILQCICILHVRD
jgi:hypothetical protein